ncbi:MAG: glycoside hydrolase family 1 protein [bacterium]|nr:glycoside hydrolase family 1 protein [bacterium]
MAFPENFLFGSATSAHQIEGGNINSDWYAWEQIPGHIRGGSTSLIACDSWNKYNEDIKLLLNTNQNAYRMSIEWAKIEPEEGMFNKKAINHCRKQFELLKKNNIKIMVTLFHFTLPQWVAKKDGFASKDNIKYFVRFCQKMAEEYKGSIDFWATLNEPNVYVQKGYIEGSWCPGEKNKIKALKSWSNFIKAHNLVYNAIKSVSPQTPIGPVVSTMVFKPYKNNILDRSLCYLARLFFYNAMLKRMAKKSDFIGLNYYLKTTLQAKNPIVVKDNSVQNDYGWHVHPEGIYETIEECTKWGKPIYITENGLADAKDRLRPQFLKDTFDWLQKAIADNLPIKGYFHWSLLDNFEWASGYTMKFGLHTIDRKPRPSAQIYAELIKKSSGN